MDEACYILYDEAFHSTANGRWESTATPYCSKHPEIYGQNAVMRHIYTDLVKRIDRLEAIIEAERIIKEAPDHC